MNPVQLIPPRVRLTIYLIVFLLALAMTAASNYFTTLEQPVPDVIRGISGGVLPPIAAVFSAVAASNTVKPPDTNTAILTTPADVSIDSTNTVTTDAPPAPLVDEPPGSELVDAGGEEGGIPQPGSTPLRGYGSGV